MSLFVDSSAWYALSDYDDKHHDSASIFLSQVLRSNNRLITSNLIIGETYTLLRARLGYREAWEFLARVGASLRIEIIFINEIIESKAYNLLKRFRDQGFSYVDGTSFVLMQERKLIEAFAYDKHFLSAGFTMLPYEQ
jgi:hypothetical protein